MQRATAQLVLTPPVFMTQGSGVVLEGCWSAAPPHAETSRELVTTTGTVFQVIPVQHLPSDANPTSVHACSARLCSINEVKSLKATTCLNPNADASESTRHCLHPDTRLARRWVVRLQAPLAAGIIENKSVVITDRAFTVHAQTAKLKIWSPPVEHPCCCRKGQGLPTH
jgi:hypothetical protein